MTQDGEPAPSIDELELAVKTAAQWRERALLAERRLNGACGREQGLHRDVASAVEVFGSIRQRCDDLESELAAAAAARDSGRVVVHQLRVALDSSFGSQRTLLLQAEKAARLGLIAQLDAVLTKTLASARRDRPQPAGPVHAPAPAPVSAPAPAPTAASPAPTAEAAPRVAPAPAVLPPAVSEAGLSTLLASTAGPAPAAAGQAAEVALLRRVNREWEEAARARAVHHRCEVLVGQEAAARERLRREWLEALWDAGARLRRLSWLPS